MIIYQITIKTESDTLWGSGQSVPGLIDNDINMTATVSPI